MRRENKVPFLKLFICYTATRTQLYPELQLSGLVSVTLHTFPGSKMKNYVQNHTDYCLSILKRTRSKVNNSTMTNRHNTQRPHCLWAMLELLRFVLLFQCFFFSLCLSLFFLSFFLSRSRFVCIVLKMYLCYLKDLILIGWVVLI